MPEIENNLEEIENIDKEVMMIKSTKEIIIKEDSGVGREELNSSSDGQDRI